jgi:prepilin-type N-terminal cleavage/methylation domain-containing protein
MKNKGFTLVELAIVLVIIGLLVGGVLQGQELIKQAQIRNLIGKFAEFDSAMNTFRAKYGELPGDFSKASNFGVDKANGAGSANVAVTGNTNNNGNGNGLLESGASGNYATYRGEMMNFWIHLSNTGLIKGSFAQTSCAANGTGCNYAVGKAYPETSVGGGVIILSSAGKLEYATGLTTSIASGAMTAIAGSTLSPEEAFAVDSKLDDGVPDSGSVTILDLDDPYDTTNAVFNNAAAAASSCMVNAGSYNLTDGSKLCTIRVRASG